MDILIKNQNRGLKPINYLQGLKVHFLKKIEMILHKITLRILYNRSNYLIKYGAKFIVSY